MDRIGDDVEAEVVRFPMDVPSADAPAGQPEGEAAVVMIASVVSALHHRGAAKFAAPDEERFIEQSALLEIEDEGGAGLVGVLRVLFHSVGEVAVLVPGLMEELDEADAPFDEAPGEQTIARVSGLFDVLDPVEIEDGLRLA